MRGGTDRRDVQGTDGKPKRTSAPPETCVKQTTRRGARARFDNVSHPGRHSPVREALRLPGEPVSDEQLIPPEWASFGGVVSPIEPGPRRPDDVVDPTGPRDWRSAKPTAAAPKVGTDRCAPACAAADTDDAGGCRGPLAGTGPLTKWPRCPEDTLAPTGPRRPEHVLAPTGPDPRAGAPSHKKRPANRQSEMDPWAEDEPVFGQREVTHALSPTPGTPPLGNLAIEPPPDWRPPRETPRTLSPSDGVRTRRRKRPSLGGAAAGPSALARLREPVRIELELEHCGRWTCGLTERASPLGLEVSLGHRGVGTRDFLSAGRRVRLLVSARGERPFQLQTRVLWVDPPSGPGRAVHAQLVVDTTDAAALARWRGLVERMHG